MKEQTRVNLHWSEGGKGVNGCRQHQMTRFAVAGQVNKMNTVVCHDSQTLRPTFIGPLTVPQFLIDSSNSENV